MGVQSLAIAVLGLALYNDYLHNVYLRIYVDGGVQRYIVAYSAFLGIALGLIGTSAATALLGGARTKRRTKPENPSPMIPSTLAPSLVTLDEQRVLAEVKTPPSIVVEPSLRSNVSSPSSLETSLTYPPGFSGVIFCPAGFPGDFWRLKRRTGDFAIPGCWDSRIFR